MSDALLDRIDNTIRILSADAVQRANSGHPGAPMGQATLAQVLWSDYLRFDPKDPNWAARDRFVLSCGHASMLQYSLLHLWGLGLTIDDLKDFRQWDSLTPGHPEVHHTPGVEVTTGPLGQGIANAVGMALAAKMLAARVAVEGDDFQPMSQRVFAICSDGDLMEGISSEAASIAGHWRLDNLVWLYDDNRITIDGSTELSFSENVAQRFEGMGWKVLASDGHDRAALRTALDTAVAHEGQPVLIICRTHIGYGSPNKVDSSSSHGAPLGDAELDLTRAQLSWTHGPFDVPADVQTWFATAQAEKSAERQAWETQFSAWRSRNPEAAETYDQLWNAGSNDSLWEALVEAAPGSGATRKISAAIIQKAAELTPALVGGSADLSGSNGVVIKGAGTIGAPSYAGQDFSFSGRQFYFGVREHSMGSITNGLLLHGGLRPFSGTFLVFSDYMRPAIRLAALCDLPNIFVFTHDSIFLGEDGPTHQPVEHHWALRSIPGLNYFRPADGVETAMAWGWALKQQKSPTAFGLTRQGVPEIQRRDDFDPREIWRGGYAVNQVDDPDVILVGTGSELHLCTGAAEALSAYGKRARVVSMPCYDLFAAQDAQYRHGLIPPGHPAVVTVEAGITQPWQALTGMDGLNIGIDRFGASAPASVLAEQFGFTVDAVTRKVRALFATQA